MKNKKLILIFIILFLFFSDLYQSETPTPKPKEEEQEEQKQTVITEPDIEIPKQVVVEEENITPQAQEKRQNSQTYKRSSSWRQGIFVDVTPKNME